jgi:hypothetical protein
MEQYIRMIRCFVLVFLVVACTKNSESVREIPPPITPQSTIRPVPTTAPTIAIGDGGLITGEPCGPPCFWGIEPGKSSQIDAYQMLMQRGLIDDCTVIDQYQFAINDGVGGWDCKPGFKISYNQKTKIVEDVGFQLAPSVMLQDIIEKHGSPDYVGILALDGYEGLNLWVSIYFFDLRITLPLGRHEGAEYDIMPTTLIDAVSYRDKKSLENDFEIFRDEMIPWKGYGIYP